jgi:hypothetical protein
MPAATHALAAFSNRFVGKSNDGECRKAGRNKNLHVDLFRIDALKSDRGNLREHTCDSTNIFNKRGGYYAPFL